MRPSDLAAVLERAFALRRPSFADEAGLHDRIVNELRVGPGHPAWGGPLYPLVTREHRLSARDRLDLFVRYRTEPGSPGVAVEVKVKGGLPDVTRQVLRYLEHDEVTGLLLVTTKSAHRAVEGMHMGKPVHVLCLSAWLL